MMAAVESYLKRDHQADWKEWEKRVRIVADSVASLPTLRTETWMGEIANHVPHLRLQWDQSVIRITPSEVAKRLREGEPSIEVTPGDKAYLTIGVWMLQPGEAQIVARRVREVLKGAA
jgi:L-seryl-tRNA(Ser) seleniumtransferase